MPADHYEVLGISRDADAAEVKRAYRRLARESHPDANHGDSGAEVRFKAVSAAYEVLSDRERRVRYDRFGHEGPGAARPSDPFGGFGDIFETFFGGGFGAGGRRRAGPTPGEDLETVLELDFEEAVFGCEQEITVRTAVACTACEATGASAGSSAGRCETCQGAGQVQRVRQSLLGQVVSSSICPICNGRGETISDPCTACRGKGRLVEERALTVHVRAGVDEGTTLRLSGRGAVGPRGGPAGDLYVHIRVANHAVFERHGYDLVHSLSLPVTQAALGTTIDFQTLDSTEILEIPRGTRTGEVFRLRGRGVPHLEGRGRGDLLVEVVVDTPTDLDDEGEGLLRQFAKTRGEPVAPPGEGMFSRLRSVFR